MPQSNVVRMRRANPGGKVAPAHPVAPQGPVRVPPGLDAAGRALFRLLARDLSAAGLYSPMDAPALALAVEHYRVARDAAAELRRDGLVVDGHRGARAKNPVDAVMRAHAAAYVALAAQFGLTPIARLRTTLAVETGPVGGDDGIFDT
jgi:P27 family predicted phage terminase small subunit